MTLTRALVEQADSLPGAVDVFLGAVLSDTFARPLHPNLRPGGYGIMGGAAKGFASQPGSIANVLPVPYRELEAAFGAGRLRADVVMLQLAVSEDGSRLSLGMANDYVVAAARRARCVIAEITRPDCCSRSRYRSLAS